MQTTTGYAAASTEKPSMAEKWEDIRPEEFHSVRNDFDFRISNELSERVKANLLCTLHHGYL